MDACRLNHVVLFVRDAARSTAFYEEMLGFRVVVADPDGGYAFLRAAGLDAWLEPTRRWLAAY